jgi:acetyl-CoA acetyltransferase
VITLEHPLSATGAVIMTKLVYEFQYIDGRYG